MASVRVPLLIVPASVFQASPPGSGSLRSRPRRCRRRRVAHVIVKLAVSVEFTVPLPVSVTLRPGAWTTSVAEALARGALLVEVAVAVLFSVAV